MVTTLPQIRGIQTIQPIQQQQQQQQTPPPPPAQKFVIVSQAQQQIIQQPVQTIQLQPTQQQHTLYERPSTPQSVLLTNTATLNGGGGSSSGSAGIGGVGGNGSNSGSLLGNIGSTVVIGSNSSGSSIVGNSILNRSERVRMRHNLVCETLKVDNLSTMGWD